MQYIHTYVCTCSTYILMYAHAVHTYLCIHMQYIHTYVCTCSKYNCRAGSKATYVIVLHRAWRMYICMCVCVCSYVCNASGMQLCLTACCHGYSYGRIPLLRSLQEYHYNGHGYRRTMAKATGVRTSVVH